MKITSVTVRKIEKENSRMKGIASVLIDDCFAVHDIRIIDGDNGLFMLCQVSLLLLVDTEIQHILLIKKQERCLKMLSLKNIIRLNKNY